MKKVLCLLVMLALLPTVCHAAVVARYTAGEYYADHCVLLADDGTLLTPRDTYGNIYPVVGWQSSAPTGLFEVSQAVVTPATEDEGVAPAVALMDETGKLLTGFDYLTFTVYPGADSILFTSTDGRMGAMDRSGNVILPGKYISLVPNGKGGYLALTGAPGEIDYNTAYPLVYIDEKGRHFDTGYSAMPYGLNAFSEGLCNVTLNYYPDGSEHAYFDYEGTNVFGKTYEWADSFYGNYAIVREGVTGLCGFIGKDGKWAVAPTYESIDSGNYYDSGTYLACTKDRAILLDAYTLEPLCEVELPDSDTRYAWLAGKYFFTVIDADTTYLYDHDGTLISRCTSNIDHYFTYSDGKPGRIICTNGEWPEYVCTLTDLSGNTVGPEFQAIYPASWIENKGRFIFASFKSEPLEDGSLTVSWTSYRYGLCDENGNVLLEPRYSSLEALSPTRYWARLGSRCGMIDETGKWYYTIDDYEYLMD